MSSATSIKHGVRKAGAHDADADTTQVTRPSAAVSDPGFRPWHFFVLASLVAATAAVVMSGQTSQAHLILISLTIASAGLAAAGFYRMLAPLASDELLMFGEPLNERTRMALEREKALTLRSIKELEFDRAMGKISGNDFDEMAGRLRARAIALMKELDVGRAGYRAEIERELDARLTRRARDQNATPPAAAARCASCNTDNDADAAFCKRCGARIGARSPQVR